MAVISALAMSVFLPKRIALAECQRNCSKSDLRIIQTVQSLAWRQLVTEAENKRTKRIFGSKLN